MPWHPFLVHFPIAYWLMGTALLAVALVFKKPNWSNLAWICLTCAAVLSLPTALTGQNQWVLLDSQRRATELVQWHRLLGNLLPWLMLAMVIWKAHCHFSKSAKPPGWVWLLTAIIITVVVISAGLLGGKLVYEMTIVGVSGPRQ